MDVPMDKALAQAVWNQKMKAEKNEQDPDFFSSMAVLPDLGGPDETDLALFQDPEQMAKMPPGELALRAAEHGQTEVLRSLIKEHPIVVHTTDSDQYTPLHRACYGGHVECACILLQAGADPNALTCESWTPLHSACRWNKWQCAKLLLQNGVDINRASSGGQTALHLAATTRQVDHDLLAVMLSDQRLDASIRNSLGETAKTLANRESYYANMLEAVDDCLDVNA
eukprot:scpid20226/ scgid17333/ Ankyrin repeat domain-containing protein 49; Fetal globin-inducing factor